MLKQSGTPVNANHDFQFSLWTTASGETQVGSTLTLMNVLVQNGLFTVSLDFGAVWDGSDRYLQIAVRPAGSGNYTTLSPRVKINPTPYAIQAGSLTLPFTGSAHVSSGAVFSITNTDPSGLSFGVAGRSLSTSGRGVHGLATATSGTNYGGYFESRGDTGRGVFGWASRTSGTNYGVSGETASTAGFGVHGLATATSGTNYGGYFESRSSDGRGVVGVATATSGITFGVIGESTSSGGRGVYGLASRTVGLSYGVWGESRSNTGVGVVGFVTHTTDITKGVWGITNSSYSAAYGVLGEEPAGSAGHALFAIGSVGASIKSFQIDHPLNPETHYLNHFCAEGPEPYNVYRGNVVTDTQGYATITLPAYFESINRDPTYHLTVIDSSDDFILAKVVREIQNNQFVIRTSKPNVKVSWEVKALRNDRYVQRYGFQTEQEKEDEIKGKYLHPELYGQPKERAIHYRPEPEPAHNETTKP